MVYFRVAGVSLMRLINFIAFLDILSAGMIVILLPVYLRDKAKLSATMSGLILSVYGSVQFFSSPIVGSYADQKGYRHLLIACLLCCCPAYTVLSVPWLPMIFLSRFLAGAFKHTQNLLKTVIAACLPYSEQLKAFARVNALGNVGFIVGPFLSGHIVEVFGYQGSFVCCAMLFGSYAGLIWLSFPHSMGVNGNGAMSADVMTTTSIQSNGADELDDDRSKSKFPLWSGLQKMDWRQHWDLFIVRFCLSFAVQMYRSNFTYFVIDRFGLDQKGVGYLISFQGLLSFLTSYFAKEISANFTNLVTCYAVAIFVFICGVSGSIFLAHSINMFMLFLCVISMSVSVIRPISYELTSERCHKHDVGLVTGIYASVISISRASCPALGGFLYDVRIDLPASIAIVAATVAFCLVVLVTIRNQIKHRILIRHAKLTVSNSV